MSESDAIVTVRPVRPEDLPRLWEMVRGLAVYERLEHEMVGTAEGLARALFGTPRRLEGLIAARAGRAIGYALIYEIYSSFHTQPALWLEDLFVEESSRGHGAGRALMTAVARIARERGYARVGWLVLDWNEPSIRFYEQIGGKASDENWKIFGLDEQEIEALAAAADVPSGRK
jgi:GNAT superfamily N-acetyltransferase